MAKYIFVTGGVVSGLGKGITAASLGRLLKARGFKVTAQKLDPYLNVDPGTMSPLQHGEVFVTADGAETDLDLGHYERFIDEDLNKYSNLTSGRVYWNILNREREGGYLGQTVQIIPHVTNEIKSFIYANAKESGADIVITEIGGTIGDIESQPFLEAARQVALDEGRQNCLYIHVSYVPFLKGSDEHKSKPTQHSVKELQSHGISPDVIVARADEPLEPELLKKIALFCNVREDCVIENLTLPVLYEAPVFLHEKGLDFVVCRALGLFSHDPDLTDWKETVHKIKTAKRKVKVAIVGKYTALHDAYISVAEALRHAGYSYGVISDIQWIDSEKITAENVKETLKGVSGIVIPGGFGDRGIAGMIETARYARENGVPILGICLGMQILTIEYARNVLGYADADSREFSPETAHPVIDFMPDQYKGMMMGGTMRLGNYPCKITEGSLMARLYGVGEIAERHRHRYEYNNDYREALEGAGLSVCGQSPGGEIVEAVCIESHPFYIGVQFHPEFKSRPNRAHPLFRGLLGAALERNE